MKWKIEDFNENHGVLISLINSLPDAAFLEFCGKMLNSIGFGWNVYFVEFTTSAKGEAVVTAYLNVGDFHGESTLSKSQLVTYLKAACQSHLSQHPQDSEAVRGMFQKVGENLN